jgi:taurine dioxygenase
VVPPITTEPIASASFGRVVEIADGIVWSDDEEVSLRSVFDEHQLVLMRRQSMTYDEQLEFVRHIGPVLSQPERAYVSNVAPGGILRNTELEWHSDLLFTKQPYHGLSLLATDVRPGVAYTAFASAVHAARALPPDLRARLEGLRAVSISEAFPAARSLEQAIEKGAPYAIHPLLGPHPYNGAEMLFADRMHTQEILGLAAADSAALLAAVFEVLYAQENTYTHWWQPGDLIVWDNLALQHARGPLDPAIPRTLQRIRMGEASLEEQVPGYVYAQNNMM